jgi:hypothetical protein
MVEIKTKQLQNGALGQYSKKNMEIKDSEN